MALFLQERLLWVDVLLPQLNVYSPFALMSQWFQFLLLLVMVSLPPVVAVKKVLLYRVLRTPKRNNPPTKKYSNNTHLWFFHLYPLLIYKGGVVGYTLLPPDHRIVCLHLPLCWCENKKSPRPSAKPQKQNTKNKS